MGKDKFSSLPSEVLSIAEPIRRSTCSVGSTKAISSNRPCTFAHSSCCDLANLLAYCSKAWCRIVRKRSGVCSLRVENSARVCSTNTSPCAGDCAAYSRNFPSSSITNNKPWPPFVLIARVADSKSFVISDACKGVSFAAVFNSFRVFCRSELLSGIPKALSPFSKPRSRAIEIGARSPEISTGQKFDRGCPLPFVFINLSYNESSPSFNIAKACWVVKALGSPSSFAA